jgi:hypothetical protein
MLRCLAPPPCRHSPVTAIGQSGGTVGQACRLNLRQSGGWRNRSNQPRPLSLVITHPVNVDATSNGSRRDFEKNSLSCVHADVCGKSLNVCRASFRHIPLAWRIPRQAVLRLDRVPGCPARGKRRNRKLTFKQVGACIPKPGEFLNSAPQNLPSRPDRNCKLVEAGESGLIAMPAGSLAENCPFGRCFLRPIPLLR